MPKTTILIGNNLNALKKLADKSVRCVVTSPPYWGLRDYGLPPVVWGGDPACEHEWGESLPLPFYKRGNKPGDYSTSSLTNPERQDTVPRATSTGNYCQKCGAWLGTLGLEPTPELYVEHLVLIFREVKRVLADDGTLWLNIGDSRAANRSYQVPDSKWCDVGNSRGMKASSFGMKPKDLVGIPWMVAFALRADGWYLRSDIIWCLSGGTRVYARTQTGDGPITVKDLARRDPKTVKLWNGKGWTQLLGVSKSVRTGDAIELVLRSGERISCTPTHKFPTQRGLVDAGSIRAGDVIESCQLPEPERVKDCALDEDAAWFAGLYIAEGSMSGETIQIAGHVKEESRWQRLQSIAAKFGGTATRTVDGNKMDIRLYGKVLRATLDELVTGRVSSDKGVAPTVWRYSNKFLASLIDGYLSGDGHEDGNRWRISFCRNYNLERDLRIACARLGYRLTLNMSRVKYNGGYAPTFRGEIRKSTSGHRNEKDRGEVVAIRRARCRSVYDIGVEDEPHLFSLASGILTHNSKPNVKPESVTDRPTSSHEHVFLFSKSQRYYYDNEAIKEPNAEGDGTRNRRDVWSINTKGYKGAHFAVFPPALVEPCILAGTSEKGKCPTCGAPWRRVVERQDKGYDGSKYGERAVAATGGVIGGGTAKSTLGSSNGTMTAQYATVGWEPTCTCPPHDPIPDIALDPFGGAGTTALVASRLGRDCILVDASEVYCVNLAAPRIRDDAPMFNQVSVVNVETEDLTPTENLL